MTNTEGTRKEGDGQMLSNAGLLPNLDRRSPQKEWMETLDLSTEQRTRNIEALDRINRLTGAYRVSLAGLERFVSAQTRELTVLDVGTCGGGFLPIVRQWAQRRDISVIARGIDLVEDYISHARETHSQSGSIQYRCTDLFDLSEENQYDVVHMSLTLHHFDGRKAESVVSKMSRLSRQGVIVNDLHRHLVHWLGAKALIPILTRDPVARNDGPVSVRRGFTRQELQRLGARIGLTGLEVDWYFPFRWLLIGRPPS